jgi:hypothetical protein
VSEDSNDNSGAAPPAAAEETFTLTRAQLDEFKARTLAEHTPAAPKMSPLDAYYAGAQGRKPSEQRTPGKPGQAQGSSEIAELTQMMKLQLMASMAASAPKPPAPIVAMSPSQKLQSDDHDVFLSRGSVNQWSRQDQAALTREYADKLTSDGFRGDIKHEAEMRAVRHIAEAAKRALSKMKITPTK